jgi:hypothetical protein
VNSESAREFPLKRQENQAVKLGRRVEAMKVSTVGRAYSRAVVASLCRARAGSSVASPHHDFLTLSGTLAGFYDYRLGKRPAIANIGENLNLIPVFTGLESQELDPAEKQFPSFKERQKSNAEANRHVLECFRVSPFKQKHGKEVE